VGAASARGLEFVAISMARSVMLAQKGLSNVAMTEGLSTMCFVLNEYMRPWPTIIQQS
jgi:hypothetical protein